MWCYVNFIKLSFKQLFEIIKKKAVENVVITTILSVLTIISCNFLVMLLSLGFEQNR